MNKIEDHSTPGPWIARVSLISVDVLKDDDSSFGIVCGIGTHKELKEANYPLNEAISNAHLIASAPEMRDFIADIAYELSSLSNITTEQSKILNRAESILKKAYNF